MQNKRHHLKKETRSLADIIYELGSSGEIADYDNAAFVQRAGEVIARAASDGKPKPPAKSRRDRS